MTTMGALCCALYGCGYVLGVGVGVLCYVLVR
jgi:hypothetical protein